MKALDRKLLRDLSRMRAQLIAIVLVVACGVASYVSMLSVHSSLERSGREYFAASAFPDVFARVGRTPDTVAERLQAIPGVETVVTRVVRDVTLDVPGMSEPAVGRLVSIPADEQPRASHLHLRKGRWIAPGRDDEVLVSEAFALAHGLEPGDRVTAILAGRRQSLEIVGLALSPEYIFSIGSGSPWPDDKRFGVLWMSAEAMAAAFDMEGAFDDVTLTLQHQVEPAPIIDAVDRILEPYGGLGAVGRDKQVSYRFVHEELEQLDQIGTVMPTIFLGVAAFLLNVVMSRLVGGQREQIAALKALGYGNLAVGLHYVKLVAVVAVLGSVMGTVLGSLLGGGMLGMYEQFYRFPALVYETEARVVLNATVLSLVAGVLGTFAAVRRAVSLPPAEAMRPPTPAKFRRSVLERVGLGKLLGPSGRIVLRNLSRHPLRTLSSILGIALSMAILISGNFSVDALEYVMHVNFEVIQREDLTVNFDRARSARAIHELENLPGVVHVEPSRDVPVRLWSKHRSYETVVMGLPADGALRRILDEDLQPVPLPDRGVLLTRELGNRLGLSVGDTVAVEVLEERRPKREVQVAGLVDEMFGMQAYMEIHAVHELLKEGDRVTGARLLLDPIQRDLVYREIKELPYVAGATLRSAAWEIFNETTAQMQTTTAFILVVFASVVAVGVVYNGARVVLAERSRELASLRVLGFSRGEISTILLGELGVQLVAAVPLGCLLGYMMAAAAIANIDTELYRFPLIISPRTYALASATVLVVGSVTALIVRRKLDHLDLVEVLKTRE